MRARVAESQRERPRRGRSRRGARIVTGAPGSLRLTVLGSSNSTPRPRRACSSYLLEFGERGVVIDLGHGSLGNLHAYRKAEDVDAVVISHMHADHFLDLVAMRYALKYGPRSNARRVRLCLPPNGETMLRKLVAGFSDAGGDFLEQFAVETYDPAAELRVGEAAIRFAETAHYIPTFAMRLEAGGSSFAYSADTGPSASVAALGRNAGLFAIEATLAPGEVAREPRGHLSASESGVMARDAQCRHLLLTHYPAELTAADLQASAAAAFENTITVADDHARFDF